MKTSTQVALKEIEQFAKRVRSASRRGLRRMYIKIDDAKMTGFACEQILAAETFDAKQLDFDALTTEAGALRGELARVTGDKRRLKEQNTRLLGVLLILQTEANTAMGVLHHAITHSLENQNVEEPGT